MPGDLPSTSPWLVKWFTWWLNRYLRKHFQTLCIAPRQRPDLPPELPLVVYVNHPSWWDPLAALIVRSKLFPERSFYAPMDARALAQYPIFEKLGFYGVEQNSRRGAMQFLKISKTILAHPKTSIWMTPTGRFADPRELDVPFQPGLAHLAHSLEHGILLPIALEYPFWEERKPEILARLGEPIEVADHPELTKEAWQDFLQTRLRATQEQLTQDAIGRSYEPFEILLAGNPGIGGLYDFFRWVKAKLRGESFRAGHGSSWN
ncbi:Glycerol acyltransferase [Planctomycetales bacterium 10988]|nr:Glycerol acyltransferase [Planctomycetales bacterium 10988]